MEEDARDRSSVNGWTGLRCFSPQRKHPRFHVNTGATVLALLLVALVAGCAPTSPTQSNASGTPVPTGSNTSSTGSIFPLPSGIPAHFSFGLMSAPGDVHLMNDMRSRNGTAWDFRYQYLAGGVNTGKGWETWSSSAAGFATAYLTESTANHYIPVFVYYEMRQSQGACDACTQAQYDLSNLNSPTVMRAYYANWRLLMQKIAAFGRPVLVIVEPDLWSFMEQSVIALGNVASAVPASVASSGDPDAAGFPNNGQGFAWTLLHIRDRYAPNAVLALHVSNWATGNDINSSTDPVLDVSRIEHRTAQFLKGAGLTGNPPNVSSWDILSDDIADHDSGQGIAWWDRTNQSYPNFTRYLTFASALTQDMRRNLLLWQVPEGNQYFDTENNTAHHTQDNRAEYILGHVADFARAGIVGVLFGPGNFGTSVDDAAHDGVTNPAPITSFECNRCNNHVSIYADDDGGYLRLFVGAYYRHGPLKLTDLGAWTPAPTPDAGATVPPPPAGACTGAPRAAIGQISATPNPVAPGHVVTFAITITMSCNTTVLVDIEANSASARIFQVTQDNVAFKQNQPRTITVRATVPVGTAPGTYLVRVGVFQVGWGPLYSWDDGAMSLQVT